MGKDIDEDLIEATIRRIQAQSAAEGDDPPSAAPATDEIRAPARPFEEASEDPIEATIRRVQAEAAARASAADGTPELAEPEAPAARGGAYQGSSDDPIEETIRRVQAQASAMRGDLPSEFAPAPLPPLNVELDDEDVVEEAIQFAEAHAPDIESDEGAQSPPAVGDAPPIEVTSWPGRDERMLGEPASWEVAAQRLEQGLQDTQREVRSLAARIEALMPSIEKVAREAPAPGPQISIVPPARKSADDSWDDSPKVSPMQFGAPPRPAIFRDPSPQTATAEELVEEPAAGPVAPAASAPRLHAVGKDDDLDSRLPRQYRITVEDKRRGVDLVPLHRALQGLDHVKDMSLLSYSNGVAIVSVESVGAIDPETLRVAVERAMSRQAKIEIHNEQTMVVKIQEA